ncbi:MAG: hypothetical protein HY073_03000 [Deltaproteobacteria bacterium]|nr:hypothetical protein [Deltaproteobacteria bacterium]
MRHRTQVLFDMEQYSFLKSLSRQEGRSLGEILRQFVEEKRHAFSAKGRKDRLTRLIGSLRDKECTSENYKDFLYGKKSS